MTDDHGTSRPNRRGLEPLGDVLDVILGRLAGGPASAIVRLVESWDEVAGEAWAAKSRPVGLSGGTLTVEVKAGTAIALLKYQVAELRRRLDEVLGAGLVRDVVIRVAPRWESAARRTDQGLRPDG